MTTTMMRLRQHLGLASPAIYTSAIGRLGNNTPHRRRTSTAIFPSSTQKQLLLLVILLFFFVLIPSSVLLPPARPRIMSSSASDSASSAAPFEKPRVVVNKVLAESQPEGQGATVRRSIGRYASWQMVRFRPSPSLLDQSLTCPRRLARASMQA